MFNTQSYAQHNCAALITQLRANTRALEAELEKCRQERQQLHRETLEHVRKEFVELQKDLTELNAKLGIVVPPPPSTSTLSAGKVAKMPTTGIPRDDQAKQAPGKQQPHPSIMEPHERDVFDDID